METTRTSFELRLYRAGKAIGLPFSFDTMAQAKEHAQDAARQSGGTIMFFDWRERPNTSWNGLVINEIRTLHREGGPLSGVRIFA